MERGLTQDEALNGPKMGPKGQTCPGGPKSFEDISSWKFKMQRERIESTFTGAALTTACRRRMDPAPWLGLAEQAVSVSSVADGPHQVS